MKLSNGWIVITGATSGFGLATARLLANRWPEAKFILTGRRKDRLDALVQELGSTRAKAACFDVRSREEVNQFSLDFKKELENCTVLINNAGLAAGLAPFQEANEEDWDQMIDTNLKGLLYITRKILPHMILQKNGHIVNMGSIAGHLVYPKGHVYNATKFAVKALNEALRLDLLGTGIRVTSVDPGLAETEFSKVRFKGDDTKAKAVYAGIEALQPEDIAETIFWCLDRPRHVNIQEVIIMPTEQASPRDVFRK
jgi:3-hydroxy acid dehydrogenase / malonic semialdehyde reductase